MTRVLVGAVAVLAAAAAADALLRGRGAEQPLREAAAASVRDDSAGRGDGPTPTAFPRSGPATMERRLQRARREHLGRKAVADAFPAKGGGRIEIVRVAVARKNTVALGVHRRARGKPPEAAVQVWRDRRLLGAFTVPVGSFGGGLALSPGGGAVVMFSYDGALRGIFDHDGKRLLGLRESFPAD